MTKAQKLTSASEVLAWVEDVGDYIQHYPATEEHTRTAEYLAKAVQWYEQMASAGITTVDRETVLQNERLRDAFDAAWKDEKDTMDRLGPDCEGNIRYCTLSDLRDALKGYKA